MYHQVWINAPREKVFEGFSTAEALSEWWEKHESTETPEGLVLSHDTGPAHGVVKQKVIDLVPNTRVEWECVSKGHAMTSPASAWPGTHVIWEISDRENRPEMTGFGKEGNRVTVLDFQHSGWDESSEFYGYCNSAWGEVLQMLKKWCEE